MNVPESFGLEVFREAKATALEIVLLEGLAREFCGRAVILRDPGAKSILFIRGEAVQPGIQCDLPLANRCVDLHIGDTRARGRAFQIDIAAQTPAFHRAFHLSGRGRVAVREHNAFEWHSFNTHTENVRGARPAEGREVQLAARKDNGPRVPSIQVDGRMGIHIFCLHGNTPADPFGRYADLPLIPGGGDAAQVTDLPAGMSVDGLGIFLHIIRDARPAPGDLKVAPPLTRRRIRIRAGRLPAPQTINAYPLARRR